MSTKRIWVGGYTNDMNGTAQGISLLVVAPDGSLENRGVAAAADSPTFLKRAGDLVYSVAEGSAGVAVYRMSGEQLFFHGMQDAAGDLPCSLAVLNNRSALVVACYGSGAIDVHPLAPDGSIARTGQTLLGAGSGPWAAQDGPHAHDVLQVDDSTVLTTDLGSDDVYVHSYQGELLTRTGAVKLPTGSGPRDLFLHPSGAVWVLAELSNEIFVLSRGVDGFAISYQVGLPGAEHGDHAAALALSTDGRFAYSGLRGSDNVSVLAVSDDGSALMPVGFVGCGGSWPRHLVVDGPWLRVANQLSNSVVTFAIGDDGMPVEHSSLRIPSPAYLLLD